MYTSMPLSSRLAEKLAHEARNLRPFLSLEYDPMTNVTSIVTESLVPSRSVDPLSEILAGRRKSERSKSKRFVDNFRNTLGRQIKS